MVVSDIILLCYSAHQPYDLHMIQIYPSFSYFCFCPGFSDNYWVIMLQSDFNADDTNMNIFKKKYKM